MVQDDSAPGNSALTGLLSTLAGKALKPEEQEPGPGDAIPTGTTPTSPVLVTNPDGKEMVEADVRQWWKRVELWDERLKKQSEKWDLLLNEYLPLVKGTGDDEEVRVPKHFRNVHSKIGLLFYRTPELVLSAKDPSPAQDEQPNPQALMNPLAPPLRREDIISIKQAVLQDKLGRDNINYSRLMDELLFDVLAWSGIACSKLGYLCITKAVQEPVMQPGPPPAPQPPMPGAVLGLQLPTPAPPSPSVPVIDPQTGQPMMRTVQVPVYEEYYERRFSPKKLICNHDLYSTRHDQDATLMGMHFYMSRRRAQRTYQLTDLDMEEIKKGEKDDRRFKSKDDTEPAAENDLIHGVELFLRAAYYSDEMHPQVIYQLTLLEGLKRPVVWRLSPDQTIGQNGKLTADSLIGFPIKVLALRDSADSPFPHADSAFTNNEVKQINTWRRQGVNRRDAAIGHYLYDSTKFNDSTIALLKSHKPGRYIPVEDGGLQNGGENVLTTTAQVHQTADDARTEEMFSRDIDETLGIGSVQAGAPEDTVRTATEIANVQAAVQGRNGKELTRTVDFFLDSARKIDALLMRYATDDDYVEITGETGDKTMQVWNNKTISGRYIYDIAPDSQMSVDTARDRQQSVQLYNLTAMDPLTDRIYLLRRIARQYGMDPMKWVKPAPSPMPGMPPIPGVTAPPNGTAGPGAAPLVAQPPHGGAMASGSVVNQHLASNSGRRPNEPGATNFREGQVR